MVYELYYFSLKWKCYTIWSFFPQQIFRSLSYWHPIFSLTVQTLSTGYYTPDKVNGAFFGLCCGFSHVYYTRDITCTESERLLILGPVNHYLDWPGTCLCKTLGNLTLTSPATCRPTLPWNQSDHYRGSSQSPQYIKRTSPPLMAKVLEVKTFS